MENTCPSAHTSYASWTCAKERCLHPLPLHDFGTAHAQPFELYKRNTPHPSSHSITPTQNVHIFRDTVESYPSTVIRVTVVARVHLVPFPPYSPSHSLPVSLTLRPPVLAVLVPDTLYAYTQTDLLVEVQSTQRSSINDTVGPAVWF